MKECWINVYRGCLGVPIDNKAYANYILNFINKGNVCVILYRIHVRMK